MEHYLLRLFVPVIAISLVSGACDPNCAGGCSKKGAGTCDSTCALRYGFNPATFTCLPCDPHCASACNVKGPGFCDSACDTGYKLRNINNRCISLVVPTTASVVEPETSASTAGPTTAPTQADTTAAATSMATVTSAAGTAGPIVTGGPLPTGQPIPDGVFCQYKSVFGMVGDTWPASNCYDIVCEACPTCTRGAMLVGQFRCSRYVEVCSKNECVPSDSFVRYCNLLFSTCSINDNEQEICSTQPQRRWCRQYRDAGMLG